MFLLLCLHLHVFKIPFLEEINHQNEKRRIKNRNHQENHNMSFGLVMIEQREKGRERKRATNESQLLIQDNIYKKEKKKEINK